MTFSNQDFIKKSSEEITALVEVALVASGTKGGKSLELKQEEIVELVFDGGDGTVFYADLNEMIWIQIMDRLQLCSSIPGEWRACWRRFEDGKG